MKKLDKSEQLYAKACHVMPGGVSSPVRAFRSVGGHPVFFARGSGSRVWDADGNEYIDYVGSWGPLIAGHAHPEVVGAIKEIAHNGISFGAPIAAEAELAEKIIAALPGMDMVRFVSSGTEACMSAIRLARAFTGRDKIVKFDGHYHGHSDALLAKAGSGVATLGIPACSGVPAAVVATTITLPYNDSDSLEKVFRENAKELAAVIFEPIAGNMGFVKPEADFLATLQKLCQQHGTLLIVDEVMTGFRVAWGGAQRLLNIKADITTLGKVIGGGMPLAAFGGRREIMSLVAPLGSMYQAGTLSGNPLAVACGLKTLEIISRPGTYEQLSQTSAQLVQGLVSLARKNGIPLLGDWAGGMFGLYFSNTPVRDFAAAQSCNTTMFRQFFHEMLQGGVYLAPSAFEAGFVSLAHNHLDIQLTLEVAGCVMQKLGQATTPQ